MASTEQSEPDGGQSTLRDILNRLNLDKDEGDKPDLSLDQLIVAAIASSDSGRLTVSAINHWICSKFKWYANRHESCHSDTRMARHEGWFYVQPCQCEISLAVQLSTAANSPAQLHGLLSPFRYHRDDRSISVLPGYSERILFPSEIEAPEFHFYSRLPTEIRVEILRQAFTYNLDQRGWRVEETPWLRSQPVFFVATIDGRRVSGISQNSLLSPLLVNKQMHAESAMLFFTQNNFHFDNCCVMFKFLQRIGAKNRGWITSVSLDYMVPGNITYDRACAHKAFRSLSEAKKLHSLRITMDETNIAPSLQPVQSFPGFHILRKLRGLRKVVFEGQCAKAEAYLKHDLMTPSKRCTGELVKSVAQLEAERLKRKERARKAWAKEIEMMELRREARELIEEAEAWSTIESAKQHPQRRRLQRRNKDIEPEVPSDDEDEIYSWFDDEDQ